MRSAIISSPCTCYRIKEPCLKHSSGYPWDAWDEALLRQRTQQAWQSINNTQPPPRFVFFDLAALGANREGRGKWESGDYLDGLAVDRFARLLKERSAAGVIADSRREDVPYDELLALMARNGFTGLLAGALPSTGNYNLDIERWLMAIGTAAAFVVLANVKKFKLPHIESRCVRVPNVLDGLTAETASELLQRHPAVRIERA